MLASHVGVSVEPTQRYMTSASAAKSKTALCSLEQRVCGAPRGGRSGTNAIGNEKGAARSVPDITHKSLLLASSVVVLQRHEVLTLITIGSWWFCVHCKYVISKFYLRDQLGELTVTTGQRGVGTHKPGGRPLVAV